MKHPLHTARSNGNGPCTFVVVVSFSKMNKVQYGDLQVELTALDIECLNSGTYLNESVVDFFLCLYARKFNPQYDITVVSYRWYCTLTSPRYVGYIASVPDYINDSLRVNFFGVQDMHQDLTRSEYVFVPVNVDGDHWILAVIMVPNMCRVTPHIGREAAILFFDSHNDSGSDAMYAPIAETLRAYMNCEWYFHSVERRGRPERRFTAESCPIVHVQLHQQRNGFDCGVYVVRACELFTRDLPVIHEHMGLADDDLNWLRTYFRSKMRVNGVAMRTRLKKKVYADINAYEDGTDSDGSVVMLT